MLFIRCIINWAAATHIQLSDQIPSYNIVYYHLEMRFADSGLLQWPLAVNILHLLHEYNICSFFQWCEVKHQRGSHPHSTWSNLPTPHHNMGPWAAIGRLPSIAMAISRLETIVGEELLDSDNCVVLRSGSLLTRVLVGGRTAKHELRLAGKFIWLGGGSWVVLMSGLGFFVTRTYIGRYAQIIGLGDPLIPIKVI